MPKKLDVISHCARSPWFACTHGDKAVYGEYAGRLVLLSLGGDPVEEYWTLRKGVGLFDVPERPVEISGRDAVAFIDRLFTRPVGGLRVGRGAYALLCHQGGGLVCDGILFRLAEDRFWYVHADNDVFLWLTAHAHDYAVEINDPQSWVLQVQGPKSMQVLARAVDGGEPDEFRYFDVFEGSMGGQAVLVSRTGWSAELGFEVYNLDSNVDGPSLWDHLMNAGAGAGIRACAQMSMNIRRIEGGILNYPTDIGWLTTPFDVGLARFVDLDGRDFVGRDALRRASREPRFCGFKCAQADLPFGAAVSAGGKAVGRITAFENSPYLGHGVGFVLFDSADMMRASDFSVSDRAGGAQAIELVELPFYDTAKKIPRGLPPDDGSID